MAGSLRIVGRHLFALPLVAALMLGVGGCSAPAEPDASADAQNSAVTTRDVVPDGAQTLLENEPAGPDAANLGIATWSVFLVHDSKRQVDGAAAYALDDNGQILYSVVAVTNQTELEASSAQFAAIRFDADGPAADQTIDADTRSTLEAEARRLGAKLDDGANHPAANDGWSDATKCAVGIGAVLLTGVALAVVAAPAATVGEAAFLIALVVTETGILLNTAVFGSSLAADLAGVPVSVSTIAKAVYSPWLAVGSCGAAVEGS